MEDSGDVHFGLGYVEDKDVLTDTKAVGRWAEVRTPNAQVWKLGKLIKGSAKRIVVLVPLFVAPLLLCIEQDIIEVIRGQRSKDNASFTDRHLDWANRRDVRARPTNADALPSMPR